jgi:hypothetical protein
MTLTNMLRIASFSLVLAGGGAAFAKGGAPTPQTHHCKLGDGSMDMKKTKKECLAAKGTWAKDADAAKDPKAGAKDAPKDAAKDAPKDAPKAVGKDAPKAAPAPAPAPAPATPAPAPSK